MDNPITQEFEKFVRENNLRYEVVYRKGDLDNLMAQYLNDYERDPSEAMKLFDSMSELTVSPEEMSLRQIKVVLTDFLQFVKLQIKERRT